MEIISEKSLVVCVNNCIADLMSRSYREYKEVAFTMDSLVPTTIELPEDFRKVNYVIVETRNVSTHAERVALGEGQYKGYKDAEGNVRIAKTPVNCPYVYYIKNNTLTVDSRLIDPVLKVTLGYNAKLFNIPIDSDLETDLNVRQELENAFVLYGLYFYITRSGYDHEMQKAYLDRYRYYVEDILSDLAAEDMFYGASRTINAKSIY